MRERHVEPPPRGEMEADTGKTRFFCPSSGKTFKNITFDVKKGEIIAVTGLYGDGRAELAEALFGAYQIDEGSMFLNDKKVNLSSVKKVIESNISLVPRNRKERGIIKDLNIMDNLSMAFYRNKEKKMFICREKK